jgi:hypothetical protein
MKMKKRIKRKKRISRPMQVTPDIEDIVNKYYKVSNLLEGEIFTPIKLEEENNPRDDQLLLLSDVISPLKMPPV